jgi:hypothetical protein
MLSYLLIYEPQQLICVTSKFAHFISTCYPQREGRRVEQLSRIPRENVYNFPVRSPTSRSRLIYDRDGFLVLQRLRGLIMDE